MEQNVVPSARGDSGYLSDEVYDVSMRVSNGDLVVVDKGRTLKEDQIAGIKRILFGSQMAPADGDGEVNKREESLRFIAKFEVNGRFVNVPVKELRRIIPMLLTEAYPTTYGQWSKKVKGMWDKSPSGWPPNVPFLDPNNKTKHKLGTENSKPKKESLMPMLSHLVTKFKEVESSGYRSYTSEGPSSYSMSSMDDFYPASHATIESVEYDMSQHDGGVDIKSEHVIDLIEGDTPCPNTDDSAHRDVLNPVDDLKMRCTRKIEALYKTLHTIDEQTYNNWKRLNADLVHVSLFCKETFLKKGHDLERMMDLAWFSETNDGTESSSSLGSVTDMKQHSDQLKPSNQSAFKLETQTVFHDLGDLNATTSFQTQPYIRNTSIDLAVPRFQTDVASRDKMMAESGYVERHDVSASNARVTSQPLSTIAKDDLDLSTFRIKMRTASASQEILNNFPHLDIRDQLDDFEVDVKKQSATWGGSKYWTTASSSESVVPAGVVNLRDSCEERVESEGCEVDMAVAASLSSGLTNDWREDGCYNIPASTDYQRIPTEGTSNGAPVGNTSLEMHVSNELPVIDLDDLQEILDENTERDAVEKKPRLIPLKDEISCVAQPVVGRGSSHPGTSLMTSTQPESNRTMTTWNESSGSQYSHHTIDTPSVQPGMSAMPSSTARSETMVTETSSGPPTSYIYACETADVPELKDHFTNYQNVFPVPSFHQPDISSINATNMQSLMTSTVHSQYLIATQPRCVSFGSPYLNTDSTNSQYHTVHVASHYKPPPPHTSPRHMMSSHASSPLSPQPHTLSPASPRPSTVSPASPRPRSIPFNRQTAPRLTATKRKMNRTINIQTQSLTNEDPVFNPEPIMNRILPLIVEEENAIDDVDDFNMSSNKRTKK